MKEPIKMPPGMSWRREARIRMTSKNSKDSDEVTMAKGKSLEVVSVMRTKTYH